MENAFYGRKQLSMNNSRMKKNLDYFSISCKTDVIRYAIKLVLSNNTSIMKEYFHACFISKLNQYL